MRKIADEQSQYSDKDRARLSVSSVYEKIKRSNSSLSRRSKKLLEDSIERVLEVFREEDSSNDEIGSFEGDLDDTGEKDSKVRYNEA